MGWEVHVACGGKPERAVPADRVVELPFRKKMTSPDNLRAAWSLRRLIRAEGYSLISTHTSLAAFFTRLAVKGMKNRPPVVNIVHGYLFDGDTSPAKRAVLTAAEKLTAGETDLIMTMNRWDHDFAVSHRLARRVVSIPGMGVDFARTAAAPADGKALRARYGIPEGAFVLIYPAEFSERKSQRVLIEALAELPENVFLLLPGDGALLDRCRDLASGRELGRRVVFPGQISDMAPWYAAADAAVTASRSEGLPFNVMEAMSRGLPVVASAVKGHTDLVEDGVTGLLYPYGDSAACAAAVRTLLGSPALRRSLSQSAKAASARYALPNVLPQITKHYLSLLPPDACRKSPDGLFRQGERAGNFR